MENIGNVVLTDEQYKPKYGMLIDGEYYVKVNLPGDRDSYESGNGEGVWAVVDEETCRAYDAEADGGSYRGILANDSIYYPGLNCGTEISFEMRGEMRPVVDIDWLESNYGESVW